MSHAIAKAPRVIVLAGPNGAGKTTAAPAVLRDLLQVPSFVNADVIAQGLSAFEPEKAAFQAGRVMLQRLKELAAEREDFAFETTLASRSFAPWIRSLVETGYAFHLFFLWLPSAELAVERVATRVRHGGHHVPELTIRRRYDRGLFNLFSLYRPLADEWGVYDNSANAEPRLIASGSHMIDLAVADDVLWAAMRKAWEHDAHGRHEDEHE